MSTVEIARYYQGFLKDDLIPENFMDASACRVAKRWLAREAKRRAYLLNEGHAAEAWTRRQSEYTTITRTAGNR